MKKNLFSLFNVCSLAMVSGAMLVATLSFAKLPAPSDEAKAKADEAKAKTAWSDKLAAYQLCKAQDKVAAKYAKVKSPATSAMPAAGASSAVSSPDPGGTTAVVTMPACTDPGPYVPVVVAATATTTTVAVPSPSSPASVVAPAAAASGAAVNTAVKPASDLTPKSK